MKKIKKKQKLKKKKKDLLHTLKISDYRVPQIANEETRNHRVVGYFKLLVPAQVTITGNCRQ